MRSLKYIYAEMLLSRGLAILGSFGVAILTARMLGPADRGRYYYAITLAAVGVQFASLGIHASNSYQIARTPGLLAQIMGNTAWIAMLGGVVAAAGVLLFDFAVGGSAQDYVIVAVVLMLAPSLLLFLYLSNIAVALNRPRTFNGLIIFGSVISIAMALLAAYLLPSLNAFLFAAAAASIVTCIFAWIVLARGISIPWAFDYSLFYTAIGFALRAHIAALLGFLMARMGVMVIRQFGDFADLGYWSIAAQIADALLILPGTISLLLFPSLVRAEGEMRWNEYKTTLFRLSSMMAVLCIAGSIVAHFLIEAIFGMAYAPAVAIVLALLPGIFFLGVASVASQFLSASGFPWSQVLAWICGSLLQAVLSLALYGRFGIVGLAWIQSGCAALVCIWLLINSLRFAARAAILDRANP
jgi:O-antigen/teichoic acid export membrane protein